MDLLFQRYANPFLLLENVLSAGRFSEYVEELIRVQNEETENESYWDIYLHHTHGEMSYAQFLSMFREKPKQESKQESQNVDFEAIIERSGNMMKNFTISG